MTATTPLVERIARVIAARIASINADGEEVSAATIVDEVWPMYRDDALSILRTLREPDEAAARAGDPAMWERMVEAAIAAA